MKARTHAFLLTILLSIFDIPADPGHVVIMAEQQETGQTIQLKVERAKLADDRAIQSIAEFLRSQFEAPPAR